MLILTHPTGNANVREAVRAFSEAGLLSEFWTCLDWNQQHGLNSFLPRGIIAELNRRSFPHLNSSEIHCQPWLELGRIISARLKLTRLVGHEVCPFSIKCVYQNLDRKAAARIRTTNFKGVYGYEGGALASFRAARQRGIATLYELPIGHWRVWRDIHEEEVGLQPEWASTIDNSAYTPETLNRKDEELSLATRVIVPSDFVRRSLMSAAHLNLSVSVIPYGAPQPVSIARKRHRDRGQKLRVLFVGALTQRKGLSYLFQSIKPVRKGVELTVVGTKIANCPALDAALQPHRWIPSLTHAEVLEEMQRHDVFVFPTLFEGLALVVLESMSQGLPVITTPNSGADNIITDGEDGFIVPIRDSQALSQKLEFLCQHHDHLCALTEAAIRKAAVCSWERYRNRLVSLTRLILGRFASDSPHIDLNLQKYSEA